MASPEGNRRGRPQGLLIALCVLTCGFTLVPSTSYRKLVTAHVAAQAEEAVGEDAAAEEGAELLLDETRNGRLRGSRAGQERLELFTYDAVEKRLLGRSQCVAGGSSARGSRAAAPCAQVMCVLAIRPMRGHRMRGRVRSACRPTGSQRAAARRLAHLRARRAREPACHRAQGP